MNLDEVVGEILKGCGSRAVLHLPAESIGQAAYAQRHKIYRAPLENETRYSLALCVGGDTKEVSGRPDYMYRVFRGAPECHFTELQRLCENPGRQSAACSGGIQ